MGSSSRLGKLCLTIDTLALMNPRKANAHLIKLLGLPALLWKGPPGNFLGRKVSSKGPGKFLDRREYSILKLRDYRDMLNKSADFKLTPKEFQELIWEQWKGADLREDVKPFLQLVRESDSDWPFEETLIFGTIPAGFSNPGPREPLLFEKSPDHDVIARLLLENDIRIASEAGYQDQPDPFYLDGLINIFRNYKSSSPSRVIYDNIKLNLQQLRSDHEDFHHLYVTSSVRRPTGAVAAVEAGFPVVRLVVDPAFEPPKSPTTTLLTSNYRKVQAAGPQKIVRVTWKSKISPDDREPCLDLSNIPHLIDFRALKEYRPETFTPGPL